jgi:hypothetical protein
MEAGVIEFESDDVDVPAAFVALAWNLYVFPFVRPVITQLVAGAFTTQLFSGLIGVPDASVAMILYELTCPPLTSEGGVTVTFPA